MIWPGNGEGREEEDGGGVEAERSVGCVGKTGGACGRSEGR